jgi:hypothetical protein
MEDPLQMECDPTGPDPCGTYTADGHKSEYVTYKAGLAKLLRHPQHEAIITNAACQVSKLATRALLLVKLYVLHQRETNGEIEKIDREFMVNALKVVGQQPTAGRTAESDIRAKLAAFLLYFTRRRLWRS